MNKDALNELLKLLQYKRFRYKKKEYKCFDIKKQLEKTVIFTDKHTLILLPSELQLIEPIDQVPIEEIQTLALRALSGKSNKERKPYTKRVKVISTPNKIDIGITLKTKEHKKRGKKSSLSDESIKWLNENSSNYSITEIATKLNSNYINIYNNLKAFKLPYKGMRNVKTSIKTSKQTVKYTPIFKIGTMVKTITNDQAIVTNMFRGIPEIQIIVPIFYPLGTIRKHEPTQLTEINEIKPK